MTDESTDAASPPSPPVDEQAIGCVIFLALGVVAAAVISHVCYAGSGAGVFMRYVVPVECPIIGVACLALLVGLRGCPPDRLGFAVLFGRRGCRAERLRSAMVFLWMLIVLCSFAGHATGRWIWRQRLDVTWAFGDETMAALEDFRRLRGDYPKELDELGGRWKTAEVEDEHFPLWYGKSKSGGYLLRFSSGWSTHSFNSSRGTWERASSD
ncbi:MAG: hypothetical protein AAB434_11700 [Planctomycetota bacterium]